MYNMDICAHSIHIVMSLIFMAQNSLACTFTSVIRFLEDTIAQMEL